MLSPNVIIQNGKAITTSLDIAKCFTKRHDNVLRCISNLDCSSEFTALNFELSTYTDCTGRNLPVYNITRDGFVFLVTGFTGKKAAQFKEAYINAFNEMEKQLHSTHPNLLEVLKFSRFLISFDQNLQLSIKPVSMNACVIDTDSKSEMSTIMQEFVPIEIIPDLMEIGLKRLSRQIN